MKDLRSDDEIVDSKSFPLLESQNGFGNGFRLPKMPSLVDLYKCETESIASSSVTSKRRIDMLFNDSRSVTSEYHNRKYYEPRKSKSLVNGHIEVDAEPYVSEPDEKNDVQVRIEKMFSEVSSSEAEIDPTVVPAKGRKFTIKHLGCLFVQCKITSIEGLQEPLRELYFKNKINRKKEQSGTLEINDEGLHIEYNANYGAKIEKLNPFSTIAAWASLYFKFRRSGIDYEYAFLPYAPKSTTDKESLFRKSESRYNEYFVNGTFEDECPIFVVAMREPDTPNKQLVCHGFICESSEDALVMAPTLFKILTSKLGENKAIKNNGRRKASINRLSSIRETSSEPAPQDLQKFLPPPKRPPRRTKLKADINDIKPDESNESVDSGDILTKVAIPRSNSFLNTNRLSSRYKSPKNSTTTAPKNNLSPLGFMEMFNEMQSQEGLKTVDEILNVIIKEEGMSFNELKPIYKEFLMKLALVLSKDELYNRSKTIMKKQKIKKKVPQLKKVITTKKGLKNVFRKPLVKLKPTSSSSCSCKKSCNKLYTDSTSTDSFFLKEKDKLDVPKLRPSKNTNVRHKTFKFRSQRITSTSEDSDYPNVNHRKYSKNKPKDDVLRPSSSGYFSFSECSYDTESCTCTSADKCYCSLTKEKKKTANFSTCSCDTLACRKRNKCYCIKPKKLSLVEQLKQKGFAVSESSLSPDDSPANKSTVRDKRYSKLSKSLEYLENSSSQYKSRMELYDVAGQKAFPCRHTYKYCPSLSSAASSKASQKKSSSSDNLAVDYSMFAKPEPNQCPNLFKDPRRVSPPVNKQNVVYAELACPQMVHRANFNHNYAIPQVIRNIEQPPVINMYPHSPIRPCSCACTCSMYHHASEMYPSTCCKNVFPFKNSTFFRRMNLENVLGYYP